MANHNKNLFIGTGGPDSINRSHFIGAAYGMERMMGRTDTPVRRILNYAGEHFTKHLPIVYVTRWSDATPRAGCRCADCTSATIRGVQPRRRALAAGQLRDARPAAAESRVHLDPAEFKSTWLGNKSVYRTRLAMADGGELLVLAPGLKEFGEDAEIDRLIRKYGYRGTPATLAAVQANVELQNNLSAAAHLIHGSSEGRFRITYCPGQLTKRESRASDSRMPT